MHDSLFTHQTSNQGMLVLKAPKRCHTLEDVRINFTTTLKWHRLIKVKNIQQIKHHYYDSVSVGNIPPVQLAPSLGCSQSHNHH